jgi:nucleoside-diphosphate-sugar epimerase
VWVEGEWMLKVLVTGANGFVGSHIVEALLSAKYYVICPVRKTSDLRWIKGLPVRYEYGDLSDKNFLEKIVKDADIIVHCAAIVRAVVKSEYFKINVGITKNLCEVVLNINPGLKKFIFISSQAAMGPSSSVNFKKITYEENPISDYGLSKLMAEKEIKKMFYKKVVYTILRPAAVYGPRDKDIFVFFNLVYKHLRPVTTIKRLLQLVYVKDVANAVAACLENRKTNNNIYYLADSIAYTWSEIGKIISFSAGVKTIPIPIPDFVFRFIGIVSEVLSYVTKKPAVLNRQKVMEILQKYWIADTELSEKDLNISFTPLEVASKITYNWYFNNSFSKYFIRKIDLRGK